MLNSCCSLRSTRAIFSERLIIILKLLSTEEYCLKLLEVKHTISSFVVLSDHFVHLLAADLLAKLLHS